MQTIPLLHVKFRYFCSADSLPGPQIKAPSPYSKLGKYHREWARVWMESFAPRNSWLSSGSKICSDSGEPINIAQIIQNSSNLAVSPWWRISQISYKKKFKCIRLLPPVCEKFMNKNEVSWINYSQVISPLLFINFDKTHFHLFPLQIIWTDQPFHSTYVN